MEDPQAACLDLIVPVHQAQAFAVCSCAVSTRSCLVKCHVYVDMLTTVAGPVACRNCVKKNLHNF